MKLVRYNPQDLESKWYQQWLTNNLFAPDAQSNGEPFCIVIPPPNVTGSLHMGHAWDSTLQDILIRWKRMQGFRALWIPGTDHAGIATQWMVESQLRAAGTSKEQIGRNAFLEKVWAFKEASHGTIVGQLRSLGVSCDWERERFTMDEGLSRAVRREFVTLYNEGLIYRDLRMINWSPGLLSAISDLEVDHKEVAGHLWHFRYPFGDGSGHITVATTRPETMLGDTAVAVHPEDERHAHLIGKSVLLPLANREIPVIADAYVDREFGSGAVKITPGHDFNDFEIGQRHGLPIITVLNEDGTLSDAAPEKYRGLDRFQARKVVVADLEALGLLEAVEPHHHALGFCSRSNSVVEPRVSTQWFVSIKSLAEPAIEAVRNGTIQLVPEYQKKIYYEWMNNIQDWCISRQLWWGHRIPVWYCQDCGAVLASEEDITHCTACGAANLEMDQDVLDTWFSSGLWPFSTMGWPDKTEDLKTYYPTAVLVTGYDILFFWVARMAMLGLKFMDEVPFKQVLLHGLLRDKNGDKMSKTKGNGIDPLDIINRYGADALRFTLAAGTVQGRDMILQEASIEGNRNFINKVWNATNFTLIQHESLGRPGSMPSASPNLFDRWLLSRLNQVSVEVNEHLERRRFNDAAKTLYGFVWHEFCDWYVEISKPALNGDQGKEAQAACNATLNAALLAILRLLHPFMPFVSEELWAALPGTQGFLMVAPFPESGEFPMDSAALGDGARLLDLIQTVRTVRGENGLKPRQQVAMIASTQDERLKSLLEQQHLTVTALASLSSMELRPGFKAEDGYAHGVGREFEVFLSLANLIDVNAERQRIGKELEKTRGRYNQLNGKLNNAQFLEKAPAQVVEKNRTELGQLETQIGKLSQSLEQLSTLN